MRFWTTVGAVTCIGSILTGGCGDSDPYYHDTAYYYDTIYYDQYWYVYDAAWAYTWIDPWEVSYVPYATESARVASFDLPSLATEIATTANTKLSPAGCANAVASGPIVSMSLSHCAGTLGLSPVNGNMTIVMSENNGQLVLSSTSSDLSIGDASFIVDSVAILTRADTRREVSVTSHSRDPNRTDSRDAQFTVAWEQGSGCVEVNGTAATSGGEMSTTSTLEGYQRCNGQCPAAGTITVLGGGHKYTARFDGSGRFVVILPSGDTKTYTLQCQ